MFVSSTAYAKDFMERTADDWDVETLREDDLVFVNDQRCVWAILSVHV